MQFKLTAMDGLVDGLPEFTLRFSAETWPEALPYFDQFLRGCGYYPPLTELGYDDENDLAPGDEGAAVHEEENTWS